MNIDRIEFLPTSSEMKSAGHDADIRKYFSAVAEAGTLTARTVKIAHLLRQRGKRLSVNTPATITSSFFPLWTIFSEPEEVLD